MRNRVNEIRAMMSVYPDPLLAACEKLVEMETALNALHARLIALAESRLGRVSRAKPEMTYRLPEAEESFDFSMLKRGEDDGA